MLDLRWLEDFVVLAETRNFTRAANLRNVSQSGFSRRIQSLEIWAGVDLIDRSCTPLEVTSYGLRLIEVARESVILLSRLREEFREEHGRSKQTVRIAAPHILTATFFPHWLPPLQSDIGAHSISVLSDDLSECVVALENDLADLLICLTDPSKERRSQQPFAWLSDNCKSVDIGIERLIPVSKPDEDGLPQFTLDDLPSVSAIPYLKYSGNSCLGGFIEDHITQKLSKSALSVRYENSVGHGLRAMALAGYGMSWISQSLVETDLLKGDLVRAGDEKFDLVLAIKMFRLPRKLQHKAEALWRHKVEANEMEKDPQTS